MARIVLVIGATLLLALSVVSAMGCSAERRGAQRFHQTIAIGMPLAEVIRLAESTSPSEDSWAVRLSACRNATEDHYLSFARNRGVYLLQTVESDAPGGPSTFTEFESLDAVLNAISEAGCRDGVVAYGSWRVYARFDVAGRIESVDAPEAFD